MFLATLIGDPSWKCRSDQRGCVRWASSRRVFLEAFRSPDDTMVRTVSGSKVVPNPSLKPYHLTQRNYRQAAGGFDLADATAGQHGRVQ